MTDLPTRNSLKRAGVTLNDARPVLRDYVRGVLMTEAEWRARIRYLERQNRKLQERLNRISNRMIGNARIWKLDRLAMECDMGAQEIEDAFDATDMNEIRLEQVRQFRADALFLRRFEYDLGVLHVAVRGDTNRRGGRYDQANWKGPRP